MTLPEMAGRKILIKKSLVCSDFRLHHFFGHYLLLLISSTLSLTASFTAGATTSFSSVFTDSTGVASTGSLALGATTAAGTSSTTSVLQLLQEQLLQASAYCLICLCRYFCFWSASSSASSKIKYFVIQYFHFFYI